VTLERDSAATGTRASGDAADVVGMLAVRPHPLRHTGATLAATTRRKHHGTVAPARPLPLYQHAADDRAAETALEFRSAP
jgi:hypothetical protein